MPRSPLAHLPFVCLAAMILASAACGGDADTNSVLVATDNGFVPFEFLDEESGELVGFDIDLIHALADRAGVELEVQAVEFDGLIAGLRSERYDVGIAGITITAERDEFVDFSQPYYDAGLILAVQADNDAIASAADLGGKSVGTRSGSTSENYLREHHADADIVAFPGIVEAYLELQSGRVDAVLYDVPNVRYYVAQNTDTALKTVGEVLQGEQYGIAYPEGSPLRDRFDQALKELKADGTYDQIYAKWFGAVDEAP